MADTIAATYIQSYETPPKLAIINLDEQSKNRPGKLTAQFNPTELSLMIKAVWAKQVVPGMSHTTRQFSHTDDLQLSFDLYFAVNGTTNQTSGNQKNEFSIVDRVYAEQFLFAACVPRGDAVIARNCPPTMLVVWPGFLSFEAIFLQVGFKYTRFNARGLPVELTASIQIEEMRDIRYTSEDARHAGFQRASGARGTEEP